MGRKLIGPGDPRTRHRGGRPFARARREMFAIFGDTCHICGHPGANEADHLVPLAVDPEQPIDPYGMRPAHGYPGCPYCAPVNGKRRKCNQSRGKRMIVPTYKAALEW